MPHDSKGRELKIGDRVILAGKITGISPSEGFCNCTVELDHVMPPESTKTTLSAINTRQLERAEKADREQNALDADKAEKEDKERAERTAKDAKGDPGKVK
jgi:hypothetical protein